MMMHESEFEVCSYILEYWSFGSLEFIQHHNSDHGLGSCLETTDDCQQRLIACILGGRYSSKKLYQHDIQDL